MAPALRTKVSMCGHNMGMCVLLERAARDRVAFVPLFSRVRKRMSLARAFYLLVAGGGGAGALRPYLRVCLSGAR